MSIIDSRLHLRRLLNMLLFGILVFFLGGSRSASSSASDFTYYIAPEGNDGNPGTLNKPFASFEGARDAIRKRRKKSGSIHHAVKVYLRGGIYFRQKAFLLEDQDSGSEQRPVVYSAYKDERVEIVGAKTINIAYFKPVQKESILSRLPQQAKKHVLKYNLDRAGNHDFGKLKTYGMGQSVQPTGLRLFYDDKPLPLARWPNQGYVKTGKIIDKGSVPREGDTDSVGGRFLMKGHRYKRWKKTDDIWVYGYWKWDWADQAIPVKAIDTKNGEVKLTIPHRYGIAENKRFYVYNLLEEIDEPGEWYLNRKTGMLYFWSPSNRGRGKIWISMLEQPFLSLRDVSHVTFKGLTFAYSRGSAIKINGGINDNILDCTIMDIGNQAIAITNGKEHSIRACDIYNINDGGIYVDAGDRPSLHPAGHIIHNNHIHRYALRSKTYCPAISLRGVGNIASNNRIHNAPHYAISFSGNDQLIELNEIYDVCKKTDDAGAIYTGRDLTARGNIIRYNFFHDIKGLHPIPYDKMPVKAKLDAIGVQAVYLDDQASGTRVIGNIFYKVQRAMLVGGGDDNIIKHNLIVNSDRSIFFDNRGMNWQKAMSQKGGTLINRLEAMPYQSKKWKKKYPRLSTISESGKDDLGIPKGNVIEDNIMNNTRDAEIDESVKEYGCVKNNRQIRGKTMLLETENHNIVLKNKSVLLKKFPKLKTIPFNKIGLLK